MWNSRIYVKMSYSCVISRIQIHEEHADTALWIKSCSWLMDVLQDQSQFVIMIKDIIKVLCKERRHYIWSLNAGPFQQDALLCIWDFYYKDETSFPDKKVSRYCRPSYMRHQGGDELTLGVAYMRQETGSALVQVLVCRLADAKPLPEPMLARC